VYGKLAFRKEVASLCTTADETGLGGQISHRIEVASNSCEFADIDWNICCNSNDLAGIFSLVLRFFGLLVYYIRSCQNSSVAWKEAWYWSRWGMLKRNMEHRRHSSSELRLETLKFCGVTSFIHVSVTLLPFTYVLYPRLRLECLQRQTA